MKLNNIIPNAYNYHPCKVVLKNEQELDCVYLVELDTIIKTWGHYPGPDKETKKNMVSIEDVVDIQESPSRLPIGIANKIFKAGETGMGYVIATYIFNDGTKESLVNAHDFINYPAGKNKDDLIDVLPHKGQDDPNLKSGPTFYYCIYSGVSDI